MDDLSPVETVKLVLIWLCGLGLVSSLALVAWAVRMKASMGRRSIDRAMVVGDGPPHDHPMEPLARDGWWDGD